MAKYQGSTLNIIEARRSNVRRHDYKKKAKKVTDVSAPGMTFVKRKLTVN